MWSYLRIRHHLADHPTQVTATGLIARDRDLRRPHAPDNQKWTIAGSGTARPGRDGLRRAGNPIRSGSMTFSGPNEASFYASVRRGARLRSRSDLSKDYDFGFAGTGRQAVNEFWDAYMNAFADNRAVLATTADGRSQVAVEEAYLASGSAQCPITEVMRDAAAANAAVRQLIRDDDQHRSQQHRPQADRLKV
jgi:hypothetical protein